MKIKSKNKRGYALVTIMGIMAVMAVTFTMLMKTGEQGVFTGKLLKDRTKATAYAEAGVEFAYAILRDDFSKRSNLSAFLINTNDSSIVGSTVETTYGAGSYTLRITDLNNEGQYIILNSVGKCGHSSIEVEAMVEDTTFGNGSAFDMAAYGGGTGTSRVGGGGFIDSTGDQQTVHCNGDINCNGGATIDANVNSGGTIAGAGNVNGTPLNNQPHMPFPPLESRYESFATYELNATRIESGNYSLRPNASDASDLMYVDGNVDIKGEFTGTIICTGEVTIKGSVIAGSSGIAVATSNGSITLNTGDACSGLFYATGDFNQQAQGLITGQIIVGGVFNKTGGGDIIFEGGSTAVVQANPVIAGWQK